MSNILTKMVKQKTNYWVGRYAVIIKTGMYRTEIQTAK